MKNSDEKYCKDCGKVINQRAEICPHCGCRQLYPYLGEKNKLVAILFAFFLGGVGAHKFYLGKIGMGVVYLVFCWTGIPTIIGLIEGVIMLGMSEEEFAVKFGGCGNVPKN